MWFRGLAPAKASPFSARLLDSLPQLVNTISSSWAPISAASCPLAVSIAARSRNPNGCVLDGLPKTGPKSGSMASSTIG